MVLGTLMLAAFVHGLLGFGFPLIATPLLVLMMDMRAAIALTLVPTVMINIASIMGESQWRDALKKYGLIPLFTVVGSFLGTQLLFLVNPEPFRLVLAVMLLAYLLTDYLPKAAEPRFVPKPFFMAVFGFLLGFLAGITNVFSPVLVVFVLYFKVAAGLIVAVFNFSFVTSKLGQIGGFISQQAFTWDTLKLALLMMPPVLMSLWLGIKLRKKLTGDLYLRLLRLALWGMSLALLADFLWPR